MGQEATVNVIGYCTGEVLKILDNVIIEVTVDGFSVIENQVAIKIDLNSELIDHVQVNVDNSENVDKRNHIDLLQILIIVVVEGNVDDKNFN